MNSISIERLREALNYDPETGVFVWKEDRGPRWKADTKAGSIMQLGYIAISLDGARLLAHRMAWAYMTGEWPVSYIDHKDGNPSNNSFANLRPCTPAQNLWNTKLSKNNTTGVKGVFYDKRTKAYRVQIKVNGRSVNKRFPNIEDATQWRIEMVDKLHGEFASHG